MFVRLGRQGAQKLSYHGYRHRACAKDTHQRAREAAFGPTDGWVTLLVVGPAAEADMPPNGALSG